MARKPRTSMFTVRSDIRTLATIARYFVEKKGYAILNRSELVNYSVELLYLIITSSEDIEPFIQTDEAITYLNALGLDTNTGGRGLNKIRDQLQKEALSADNFSLPEDKDIGESLERLNEV